MTYVPDYVRSVGPKSPPSLPATPTSSNHTRRLPSLSGSSKSTASNGRERSNSQHSEESTSSTSSRRRSASNPVYTPRPYKAPQDRLCSRVSIKDRLKSLETDAAVKLELRQTALRSKRRSLNYGTNRPLQATPTGKDRHSADSSSISSVSSIRSNRETAERVGEGVSSMPKPDIIASNQPKEAAKSPKPSEKDSAENCQTDEKIQSVIANAKRNGDVKQKRKSSLQNAKTEQENVPKQHHAIQSNNNKAFPVVKDNSEKRKRENRHNTRRTSEPDTTYCSSDRVSEYITPKLASQTASDASSADERSKPERSRAKSTENLNDAKEKNAPGSGFKPIWRTPSLKQAQKTKRDRLSSYVNDEKKQAEKTDKSTSIEPEEKKTSAVLPEAAPSLERNQEPSGATKEPGTPKTEPLEEKDASAPLKRFLMFLLARII